MQQGRSLYHQFVVENKQTSCSMGEEWRRALNLHPGKFYTLFYTDDLFLNGIGRFWAVLKSRKMIIFPLERRWAVLAGIYLSTSEACALTACEFESRLGHHTQ